MTNVGLTLLFLVIVALIAIVVVTRLKRPVAVSVGPAIPTILEEVVDWMDKMDRKTWIVEELDNEGPVDYAIGNLIARKRMEKLAQSDSLEECRVVVVFSHGNKQYKCSGVYSRGPDKYIRPKGEWFAWIAKEAVRQNGFDNATIITHIVMSPEV